MVGQVWMKINNTNVLMVGKGGSWYENVSEVYRGKLIIAHLLNKLYEKAMLILLGCDLEGELS